MDVRILQETIEENKKRKVYIFNPTAEDFSITHNGVVYSIGPNSELELPYYSAELMVNRISDYMAGQKEKVVSAAMKEELKNRVRLYDK